MLRLVLAVVLAQGFAAQATAAAEAVASAQSALVDKKQAMVPPGLQPPAAQMPAEAAQNSVKKKRKMGPQRPLVAAAWIHMRDVSQSLQEVMQGALGKDRERVADVHLDQLRDQLRPLFKALPKNPLGLLSHSTVRYALHRHFVHQHGMYIKGLEPAGELWNSSSPTDIMEDRVPAYVQHLFEDRLHTGFDLHDLALLAATLEHFVHTEDTRRLEHVYRLAGHEAAIQDKVSSVELVQMLDMYIAMLVAGEDGDFVQLNDVKEIMEELPRELPTWPAIKVFIRETLASVLAKEHGTKKGSTVEVTFATARKAVQMITEHFGRHQDGDCREMTKKLLKYEEHPGQGRVRMGRFYQAGREFKESESYLDDLGILDRRQGHTYVVVANYVLSATNCIAATRLYSLCCMDPCENILRQLESHVGRPKGKPEYLAELVANTPSSTVQAPRELSPALKRHLDEIAARHGGRVPLHGRLFAQWLHHAFPQECPYPARAGTTRPVVPDDWLTQNNASASLTEAEIKIISEEAEVARMKDLVDGDMEETLPWDEEEELVFHHTPPALEHELVLLLRAAVALILCGSFMFGVSEAAKVVLRSGAPTSKAVI